MKRLIYFLFLFTFITGSIFGQRDVVFMHGVYGSFETWQPTVDILNSQYNMKSHNSTYNSRPRIGTIADNIYGLIPENSVVLAHSLGGLVSREIVRTRGDAEISALISIGTPHSGAGISRNADDISTLALCWLLDLEAGWLLVKPDDEAFAIATEFINALTVPLIEYFSEYDVDDGSMQDMNPGSCFLNTLNSHPANSIPNATYAIYGVEYWNTPWRIADAGINGLENGGLVTLNRDLQSLYRTYSQWAYTKSIICFLMYQNNYDPDFFYQSLYWAAVGGAFHWGYYSLNYFQQYEWDTYITESKDNNFWAFDDGVVPVQSQGPPFIGTDGSRRLIALGANHLEEPKGHEEAIEKIRFALTRPDINIDSEIIIPQDLEVTFSGPTRIIYGYHKDHPYATGTWEALTSGGIEPYSYEWYIQRDGSSYWNNQNCQNNELTYYSYNTSGFTIKVIVSDNIGESISRTMHVTILDDILP